MKMIWKKAATVAAMAAMGGMTLAALPALAATAPPSHPTAVPFVPYGAIGAEWLAKGGAGGFLGAPQNNEYSVSSIPGDQVPLGARAEDFAAGIIYWSPSTGAHEVHGGILEHYVGVGGPSAYGLPLTDELTTPDRVGRYNHFQGGHSIYWTPSTGAHSVYGAIRNEWAALGWERGVLGYPTKDETDVEYFPGPRMQYFQHGGTYGQMYWSPAAGAHEVHGMILAEYLEGMGGPAAYGMPITNELTTPDGVGRFNHFEGNRSIYWTNGTGAHAVYGAIRTAWAQTGWERGALGYPVTDEHDVVGGGGRQSDFQHGYINWVNGEITIHVN